MPASHDPLGEQAATGLDVGDQVPAAVRVGGQIADGVEQPQPFLGGEVTAAAHVLLDVGPGLGILQVGHGRRRQDGTAGDVVEVADHPAELGRALVFGRVGEQLVRIEVALRRRRRVRQRRFHASPQQGGVDRHLVDLLPDVRHPGQPVGLGDQLGQADQLVGLADHRDGAAQPLPQAEGVGEHRRVLSVAVQEHPLVGHEHVIEHHEPVRHAHLAADQPSG